MTVLSAVLLFGFLIFIHELGHFVLAKLSGVRVDKFSLGFGPRVVGRKIGET
jgi:regulator of sigma E protease